MMSTSYNLQTDLEEAKAMVAVLKDYVLGTQLYGNAGGSMPSVTVGAVLMHLRRLNNLRNSMKDGQSKELGEVLDKWRTVRKEWRVHYVEKVKREAESRLDAMQTFFDECSESMLNCQQNYHPELLRRTIVQELLREIEELKIDAEAVKRKVSATDINFHRYLSEDNFQWASDLQAIYPKEEFWWLYQKPKIAVN